MTYRSDWTVGLAYLLTGHVPYVVKSIIQVNKTVEYMSKNLPEVKDEVK